MRPVPVGISIFKASLPCAAANGIDARRVHPQQGFGLPNGISNVIEKEDLFLVFEKKAMLRRSGSQHDAAYAGDLEAAHIVRVLIMDTHEIQLYAVAPEYPPEFRLV